MRASVDYGCIALDFDLGPHASEFLCVHEAIFKNGLRYGRSTVSNGIQGHELRLHVGRKRRIGRRA